MKIIILFIHTYTIYIERSTWEKLRVTILVNLIIERINNNTPAIIVEILNIFLAFPMFIFLFNLI